MNNVEWRVVGGTEELNLGIITLELIPHRNKWVSYVLLDHCDQEEPHIIDTNYKHPTREDAKTYAIAKARELLLADLNSLGGI